MVASFLVGIQLARGLGVEGYGYYGLALAILTIAGIPGELGLAKLVTREVAGAAVRNDGGAMHNVLRWADRVCWALSGIIFVGIVVAALLRFKSQPMLAWGLLLGAPMVPLMALSRIRGGALQGLHYMVRGQIPANLLKPVFMSALLAAVFVAGITLEPSIAMVLNSLTAAMVLLISHIWLKQRLPQKTETQPVTSRWRWLASTVPLALTDGRTLQSELTVLFAGLLIAAADVGLLRIAIVTAIVASAPITVLVRVSTPTIARLHAQGDRERLQKFVTYSAYAQTAGVALLSLPLLIAPEFMLSLAFGEGFAPAANTLRILCVGQIANAAFGPNIVLLNMAHQEWRATRAMVIGLVLNIAAVLLLVGRFGIEGAALGLVVSLILWNFLAWIDGRRIVGVETSILPIPVRAGFRR